MTRCSILLAATLALAATAAAYGQAVTSACVNLSSGRFRVVAQQAPCRANETAVNWEAAAPRGAQGLSPSRAGAAAAQKPSAGRTHLLFPFAVSVWGYDTALAISNTTADPFGTAPVSGSCRVHYYGTQSSGQLPMIQTTPVIAAGTTFSFTLYAGGVPGSLSSPKDFRGYVIADCAFPHAQGFSMVTDLNLQRLGVGGNAIVLPNPR